MSILSKRYIALFIAGAIHQVMADECPSFSVGQYQCPPSAANGIPETMCMEVHYYPGQSNQATYVFSYNDCQTGAQMFPSTSIQAEPNGQYHCENGDIVTQSGAIMTEQGNNYFQSNASGSNTLTCTGY